MLPTLFTLLAMFSTFHATGYFMHWTGNTSPIIASTFMITWFMTSYCAGVATIMDGQIIKLEPDRSKLVDSSA